MYSCGVYLPLIDYAVALDYTRVSYQTKDTVRLNDSLSFLASSSLVFPNKKRSRNRGLFEIYTSFMILENKYNYPIYIHLDSITTIVNYSDTVLQGTDIGIFREENYKKYYIKDKTFYYDFYLENSEQRIIWSSCFQTRKFDFKKLPIYQLHLHKVFLNKKLLNKHLEVKHIN